MGSKFYPQMGLSKPFNLRLFQPSQMRPVALAPIDLVSNPFKLKRGKRKDFRTLLAIRYVLTKEQLVSRNFRQTINPPHYIRFQIHSVFCGCGSSWADKGNHPSPTTPHPHPHPTVIHPPPSTCPLSHRPSPPNPLPLTPVKVKPLPLSDKTLSLSPSFFLQL